MSENRNRARSRAARPIRFLLLASTALLAAVGLTAGAAHAQVINQSEFTALPTGTNLAIGYYEHNELSNLNLGRGQGTLKKDTGLAVDLGVARFVHFFTLGGYLQVVQVIQAFGLESGFTILGQGQPGSGVQAADTTLGYTIWPYVSAENKTSFNLSAFINPPDGGYRKSQALNLGTNALSGDVQAGLSQGLGTKFSFDLGLDAEFYGDNNNYTVNNLHLSTTPSYRVQTFFNYNIQRGMEIGLGYTGIWGGRQSVERNFDGSKTEYSRVKLDASMFLSPSLQVLVELNHDIHVVGGFQQTIGGTIRVLKVF